MAITLLKSIDEYVNSHALAILILIPITTVTSAIFVIYKVWDHMKSCAEEAIERFNNGLPPKEGTTIMTITFIEPVKKRPINDKIIVIDPENKFDKKALLP